MTDLPRPAYTEDNPLMQGAFTAFVEFAWGEDKAHEAFCEASGRPRPKPPRNGLEAAIDRATGYVDDYTHAFLEWLIKEQWGEEGDPRMDEAAD